MGGLSQVIDAIHRLARSDGSGDPARLAASVRLRLHEPPRA